MIWYLIGPLALLMCVVAVTRLTRCRHGLPYRERDAQGRWVFVCARCHATLGLVLDDQHRPSLVAKFTGYDPVLQARATARHLRKRPVPKPKPKGAAIDINTRRRRGESA